MSPKEFVSYFNGAIEIGEIQELKSSQLKLIYKKLDTVPTDSSIEGAFCIWLKGYFEGIDEFSLNLQQLEKIAVKLGNIEKYYTEEQTVKLSSIFKEFPDHATTLVNC